MQTYSKSFSAEKQIMGQKSESTETKQKLTKKKLFNKEFFYLWTTDMIVTFTRCVTVKQ